MLGLRVFSGLTLASAVFVCACSSNDGEGAPSSNTPPANPPATAVPNQPDAAVAEPPRLDVKWESCSLDTAQKQPAECATVKVPYRWDVPSDTRTIDVFIKHYRSPGATSGGQVWLLQGGPGAWAADMDAIGPYLTHLGVSMDYYSIDQRGTGRSSRLGCKQEESLTSTSGGAIAPSEWPACIASMKAEWGGSIEGFSVTNTARDLGELIKTLRKGPDENVFVYGVSYGTYLANRYLQLYPNQATGVVLDSICSVKSSFTHSDAEFDAVVHQFFDACGQVPACSQRLGSDPWSMFGDLLTRLDSGHCAPATSAGLTRTTLRRLFAQLAYSWDGRILIPALIHRIDRCGAGDVPVFNRLGSLFAAPSSAEGIKGFSTALAFHIAFAELWDEPSPDVATLAAAESTQLVCNGVGARMAAVHDIWPRLPRDELHGVWAKTSTPPLMLAGTLDPATTLEEQLDARAAFTGAHQTFVTVPRVPHAVIANSPVVAAGEPNCGMSIFVQFLKDPKATLDTTCVNSVRPLTFDNAQSAGPYFGTNDLWGD